MPVPARERSGLKIFRGNNPLTPPDRGSVLAVGNFDGVHLGHQRVFRAAAAQAEILATRAALLTFSGHPVGTLRPGKAPVPLMLPEDRLEIAEAFGFKMAFVLDFDAGLASMSPERFTDEILVSTLGAVGVVAGAQWRFGSGRRGTMELLEELGRERGLETVAVDPVIAGRQPVSSTRIRELLSRGDVTKARGLLGRPHFVRGTVSRGRGRGKDLGFPTVNLDAGSVLIPASGTYAGAYILSGRIGPAAVNIGVSPTFSNGLPGVEAHLIGWEGDLYGETVTIVFLHRLRPEQVFADAGQLSCQIARDVERAGELFTPDAVKGVPE